jgi:hypothetical protein
MNWEADLLNWANPYYYSFRLLLDIFHQQKDALDPPIPVAEKVDFIFDDRPEKKFIRQAWDDILEGKEPEERKHYGSDPLFEKDRDAFVALQAADFWAWWVREWYEEDCHAPPTKMENFDFGLWRGRKRAFLSIFQTEDEILENFQKIGIQNIIKGNVDPLTAAKLRGE